MTTIADLIQRLDNDAHILGDPVAAGGPDPHIAGWMPSGTGARRGPGGTDLVTLRAHHRHASIDPSWSLRLKLHR